MKKFNIKILYPAAPAFAGVNSVRQLGSPRDDKRKQSPILFIIFIFFLLLPVQVFACTSASLTQFNSRFSNHKRPVTILFFSTWCAQCLIELEEVKKKSHQNNFILVAEFDTLERVNRNLKNLNIGTECFLDKTGDIKEMFKIEVIPGKVTLK